MDEIIHTNCAATAPFHFHSLLREESAHTMASEGSARALIWYLNTADQRRGMQLPFDRESVTLVTRFICSAVNKVFHLRKEKLRELEAPWLSK